MTRIAVVGGGAAGALCVIHLVRCRRGRDPLQVTLYEASGRVARGAAYSTDNPRHLLNVPAARMSALVDDDAHFARWLRRTDAAACDQDYVARWRYGDYLAQTLARHANAAGLRVRQVRVDDLIPTPEGWRVIHARGADTADSVILALGHAPPVPLAAPHVLADPWEPGALEMLVSQTRPGDVVVTIGSGLTAIDVALTVIPAGRTVVAVSRHGLLPAPQPTVMTDPIPLRFTHPPATVAALEALVTEHIATAVADGADWRGAVDGVRPHTAKLWRGLSPEERALFLNTTARRWEVVRHRMAPAVAAQVRAWQREGRLVVRRGEVLATVGPGRANPHVVVRTDDRDLVRLPAAAVVNCTGPTCEITAYPLGRRLTDRGLVMRDPLGLGVAVAEDGHVIDAEGRTDGGLYAIGALRRGAEYESTAIPEIRAQAAQLARRLSGRSVEHLV